MAQEQTSRHSSELTFKVPGEKFDATLESFGELGDVDSQWVTTEDRTSQIVDLRARLETAEASLARTRELFDAAETVMELVTAENEIAQREQTVEVLKAQLRSQEESVSLATITVYMTIDPDSLPEEPVVNDEDLPTLRRAFNNGFNLLWYLIRGRHYDRLAASMDSYDRPRRPGWSLHQTASGGSSAKASQGSGVYATPVPGTHGDDPSSSGHADGRALSCFNRG